MTVFDRLSYQGCQVALLTQHGKQDLLKAPLEAALGCHVLHTNGYDEALALPTAEAATPHAVPVRSIAHSPDPAPSLYRAVAARLMPRRLR